MCQLWIARSTREEAGRWKAEPTVTARATRVCRPAHNAQWCSPAPSPPFWRRSLPRLLRRRLRSHLIDGELSTYTVMVQRHLDLPDRRVEVCGSGPGPICRDRSTTTPRGPPSVSRRASITSPSTIMDRAQVPAVRPSSRCRHRRPERGLHRDQRRERTRQPTGNGHPRRRVPALRERGFPELGDVRHRWSQLRSSRGPSSGTTSTAASRSRATTPVWSECTPITTVGMG